MKHTSLKTAAILLFSLPASLFCDEGNDDVSQKRLSAISFVDPTEEVKLGYISKQDAPQQEAMSAPMINGEEDYHRLQVGANYTRARIKPGGHQSFNGNLWGMQAYYEFRPMNRFYGGAKAAWKIGDTHGPNRTERDILYFDTHERLGYTFATASKKWRATLFSGFGYRYYSHKLETAGANNLRFNYNEFYVPVGFLTDYAFNSWFSFGADFIWMPQVFSTVGIVPLKGARWDLTRKVCNFYAETPFTFSLTSDNKLQLTFTPFYEYWLDGHSTAKLSSGVPLGLPGNTYNFYGADLNFSYNF